MPHTWKILPKKPVSSAVERSDDLITQLLLNRDLKSKEEIEKFFHPKIENYRSELEIPGITKSQKRINQAIEKEELFIVYGDYDVDGVCASAILYKALTSIGAKVLPYIPHREKEGYGLSKIGLDFARESRASLVITVDNGIVAIDQAKYAKSLGLDLIITDHHLPLDSARGHGPLYPDAYSIVHSTKMCGAGVAWCLIKNLIKEDLRKDLLQFVAIATVCDLMPLINLGRAFLTEGLKVLRKTSNIGLKNLINDAGTDLEEVGAYEIGYIIGPRLNAIGRLEHAIDALRLLCTKDETKVRKLVKLLSDTNITRQQLTQVAIDEAKVLISGNGLDSKIHILHSETWSQGIVGLIAGRICEEYYRPAIAISVGETIAKGSARSIKGINIVELLRTSCSDILIDVGGHAGAAGFSLEKTNIEKFRQKMVEVMASLPKLEDEVLEIDLRIDSQKLNKTLAKELERFAPFGFGNPAPLFAGYNLKVSDIRTVGSGKHLKFKVTAGHPELDSGPIDCIAFGMGGLEKLLHSGQLLDLAFYLEINRFNGKEILQLKVKDIK